MGLYRKVVELDLRNALALNNLGISLVKRAKGRLVSESGAG
jgi:hypothetical protein